MSETLDPDGTDEETDIPPPVNPEIGEIANEEATQARRDIEANLTNGNITLEDVFQLADNEKAEDSPHRIVGHMHIGAALLALPHIGETNTDNILNTVGLTRDRHIASLGDNERDDLLDLVEAYDA